MKKYAAGLFVVGSFIFLGIVFTQLELVFGWTNPPCTPPNCSGSISVDAMTGNIGIKTTTASTTLTVNGIISAVGNLIKDVATPIAGTDAVNKDFVLAQTGGALTGPLVIYGYATKSGLIPPDPGTSVPACPNGYQDILYSPSWNGGQQNGSPVPGGYGPLGMYTGFGWASTALPLPDELPGGQHSPTLAIGTYSICSTIPTHVIPSNLPPISGGVSSNYSLTANACVTTGPSGNYLTSCNTCRICGKYIPPTGP